MNKVVTYGLAAAAVAAVLFVGAVFFGSPAEGGIGSQPTPTPTVEPTPSPTPDPTPPPLTESFTSTQHGISMSYPEGWTEQAATEPWTDMRAPFSGERVFDFMFDPIAHDGLFLAMASAPIGDSSPEEWMAAALAGVECTEAEPTEVDGAAARIASEGESEGVGCPVHLAVVTLGGRGYWIELYTSYDNPEFAPYDRAWFEEVLATVQLHPEDAVD
jgi:hypothetical protein